MESERLELELEQTWLTTTRADEVDGFSVD
jgi:hypothetical protein